LEIDKGLDLSGFYLVDNEHDDQDDHYFQVNGCPDKEAAVLLFQGGRQPVNHKAGYYDGKNSPVGPYHLRYKIKVEMKQDLVKYVSDIHHILSPEKDPQEGDKMKGDKDSYKCASVSRNC